MTQKQPTLRLAVAQPFCFPGDVAGNLDRMQPLIRQAAEAGAQLVLFGESNVTGLWLDQATLDSALQREGPAWKRLAAFARDYQIVVVPGFLERDGKRLFNSQAAFFPDGNVVVQRKANAAPLETKIPNFTLGPPERIPFNVAGARCAISICADTGLPDHQNNVARLGVQVHLLPTAGCGPRSWGFHEAELDDPTRFAEYLKKAVSVVFPPEAIVICHGYRMVMASCNQMADNGVDYFHCGHSMIVDSTGELAGLIPGSFVFEHLRPRVVCGDVHPQPPRMMPVATKEVEQ